MFLPKEPERSGDSQPRGCPAGVSAANQLGTHLEKHGAGIKVKLLQGRFKPSAARRKDIPKPNGDTRPLSIPNVLDRFIQQMLHQALAPMFEPTFSEASHGLTPLRYALRAARASLSVSLRSAPPKAQRTWSDQGRTEACTRRPHMGGGHRHHQVDSLRSPFGQPAAVCLATLGSLTA